MIKILKESPYETIEFTCPNCGSTERNIIMSDRAKLHCTSCGGNFTQAQVKKGNGKRTGRKGYLTNMSESEKMDSK